MADRRLQVFHAVAVERNFTRAAETLFMTQPAVTFQIRQLEDEYNARLFDRGRGQVTLTAAGELVFDYAKRILDLSGELEHRLAEMTGQVRGALLIGASASIAAFMLPAILGDFGRRFPEVRTRLVIDHPDAIARRIVDHVVDIGILESDELAAGLVEEFAGDEELVVVCAPGHALAGNARVEPAALVGTPLVVREPGSGTRALVESYLRAAGVGPEQWSPQMEIGGPEALNGVVGGGDAVAIVARSSVARELESGRLRAIPLQPCLRRTIRIVQARNRFRSRLASEFIDFAKRRLGDLSR